MMGRANYSGRNPERYGGKRTQKAAFARGHSEKVRLENVRIGKETEKAMFVTLENGEEMWMPLSQVHEIHRATDDKPASIVVSEWIAKQKGLR